MGFIKSHPFTFLGVKRYVEAFELLEAYPTEVYKIKTAYSAVTHYKETMVCYLNFIFPTTQPHITAPGLASAHYAKKPQHKSQIQTHISRTQKSVQGL